MSAPDRAEGVPDRGDWLGLAGVLAVALLFRLHALTSADIGVDEANSVLVATQASLAALFDRLRLDSSPPFFYLVLRAWVGVFGDSSLAIRSLPALCGVGLVAAVYVVGRRALSPRAALFAAFVVAVSPIAIFHAQQVRMYSLLPILGLLGTAWLVAWLREGRPRDLALFAGATALALYTHNFAFHLLPVQLLFVLVARPPLRRAVGVGLALAAVALVYAPWIPNLLHQLGNTEHYAWYAHLYTVYGPFGATWNSLRSFSPGGEFALYTHSGGIDWMGVPTLAVLVLALLGARWQLRRYAAEGVLGAAWIPLAACVPVATALVASRFLTPHFVPGRVDQLLFPFFALLVGAGMASLPWPAARVGVAVALVAVAVPTRLSFYPDYTEMGFRGSERALAEAIAEEIREGDVIVTTSLTRAPLEYYLRRVGVDASILSFPRSTARNPAAQDDRRIATDLRALEKEAQVVVRRARSEGAEDGRLFVVRAKSPINVEMAPGALKRKHGFHDAAPLGGYVQVGREEVVYVNRHSLEPRGAAAP